MKDKIIVLALQDEKEKVIDWQNIQTNNFINHKQERKTKDYNSLYQKRLTRKHSQPYESEDKKVFSFMEQFTMNK
uniref:Uncharacterized protein n=1 Tax=Romanomermis culicivorax TaxID=13658 RepID=A0A915LEG4_ROMCU